MKAKDKPYSERLRDYERAIIARCCFAPPTRPAD